MTRIIILAAGKGKRMGGEDLPKVLRPLSGRPMLEYVLDAVRGSGIDDKPIVVIGHLADRVKVACGDACDYAVQESLRGTGDAVRSAKDAAGNAARIVVLNGDMPFVTADSVRAVAKTHQETGAVMVMGTVTVEDFEGWRKPFEDFGRIVRDERDGISRIVEAKDASEKEKEIREVNPSIFSFDAAWLWEMLETLTTENAQGEYYLTDLLEKAVASGKKVVTVSVRPKEAIGINTPEQLAYAESLM